MSKIELMQHQADIFNDSRHRKQVAYYLDMGLGKTFLGSEKLVDFNTKYNLVICQKSKVVDWVNHFKKFYPDKHVIDFTKGKPRIAPGIIVVNYELAWRRPELLYLTDLTLMLDESSMIQNETAKRSQFVLKLFPDNVILLSGTPTAGKYEKLWSQCRLLGWNITKRSYYERYIIEREINIKTSQFPIRIVTGYKNVEELKNMLRTHGAYFLKTEDVLSLPEQTFVTIDVPVTPQYRMFQKDRVVTVKDRTLVGDMTLNRLMYSRQLCGMYNANKLAAFADLLDSTDDRLVVFYNFNEELDGLKAIAKGRPISEINGHTKDQRAFDEHDNAVIFVQYQAGAMGLNLQKANKIVYFTLPLSSELFEQSKKRTHRIGQQNTCFYYTLLCRDSVEEKILESLNMRRDYTNALFEEDERKRVVRKK